MLTGTAHPDFRRKAVRIQFIEFDIMTIVLVLTLILILILIAFFLGFDFRNPKITHRFLCLSTYGNLS